MVDLDQRVFRARGIARQKISYRGGRGYFTGGPLEHSESFVLLRGDRYVNVVVYNAAPGAAERLVPIAARSLL